MPETYPRVGILQSQDRRLYSQQVGMEYQLAVWLPQSYAESNRRYPVIYVLDGDLYFGLATALVSGLGWSRQIPQMIIVAIGYNRDMAAWGELREKDFKIPEVQADPPDSHADRFLAALKTEIIPFIDASYRTDPADRTLYGYSSSGFFTLYTLANEPGLFRRYLAGSPDTDLSSPYLLAHTQALAAHDPQAPIDLFVTVGSLENGSFQSSVETFNELVGTLQAGAYPGLRFMAEIYPGENHGSGGVALTLLHGLRWCYAPDPNP